MRSPSFRKAIHGLFRPVDVASLVVFRVLFGVVMLWEVVRYFQYGWIARYWIEPTLHFTYAGFDWVRPWLGEWMYLHMAALGVLALFIAAGFCYRVSATLFFVGFTYTFLLERARYLNHLYFVCLVSFLMIVVPAHRNFSIDAWLRPKLRASSIPFWPVWLLRAQLAVVYVFAGVAKLNSDWFAGEPLTSWLSDLAETPLVGPWFAMRESYRVVAWCGLAFDLLIVPFLLWRKTRPFAFVATVGFHLMNAWFFNIGIFPWLSIGMTTLFLEPGWPRRWLQRSSTQLPAANTFLMRRWVAALVISYVCLQVVIPLRHWLYPGDVAWTEEGHEFSWRMKLRDKQGDAVFTVSAPAKGITEVVNPESILTDWQAQKMEGRPELIRQFARHLAARKSAEWGESVKVTVDARVSLNGRPEAVLIDPKADLAAVPCEFGPAPWIVRR